MAVNLDKVLPVDRDPTLRVVPMPSDANYSGDIFGGWIMSQVDIAGSIPAALLAKGRIVTIAVNSFVFKQPVHIGDVVSFYASVSKVGKTSITVDVEVYAQRRSLEATVKVTDATLTYVSVDDERKPRAIDGS
ncbi:MAG: acyl-CoA thioesterase [Proteobacteria bacterium]|nr:acyl-CoA thioesterase [Pseudomonadota bacterium]MDA1332117.1 acyl-CoA thioesterase [Pseudomonadota bacterium]